MVRGAQHLLRIVQFGAVHAEHIHCVRFGRAIQDNIIEGVDGLKIIWEVIDFFSFKVILMKWVNSGKDSGKISEALFPIISDLGKKHRSK